MFGLLADQPYYSTKVKPFIALAPVCYVQHQKTIFKLLVEIPGFEWTLRQMGGKLNNDSFFIKIMDSFTSSTCPSLDKKSCESFLYSISGYNMAEINASRVDVYQGQGWSGTSLWNIVHIGQNIVKGGFNKFDYGTDQNLVHYGSPNAPEYPLDQINSTSIAIFYSKSDEFGDEKDVRQLIDTLKGKFLLYQINTIN